VTNKLPRIEFVVESIDKVLVGAVNGRLINDAGECLGELRCVRPEFGILVANAVNAMISNVERKL